MCNGPFHSHVLATTVLWCSLGLDEDTHYCGLAYEHDVCWAHYKAVLLSMSRSVVHVHHSKAAEEQKYVSLQHATAQMYCAFAVQSCSTIDCQCRRVFSVFLCSRRHPTQNLMASALTSSATVYRKHGTSVLPIAANCNRCDLQPCTGPCHTNESATQRARLSPLMFVEAGYIHPALATFALQPLPSTIAANSVEDRFWVLNPKP